jgi:biopolymer transport protein ExbB
MNAFMHFVTNDWWIAVPMFLMSLTAVTLVVWRILLNVDAKTDLNTFLPRFQKVLDEQGPEGALAFSRSQKGVIARKLFPAGLETQPQGVAAMRRAMASVIELEIVPDLNFTLAPILAIAKIATMVGLFGTVVSMINTFSAISTEQNATGVASHSKEIGLALFATALGLVTAIPLVFSHVLFKDWIARYELKLQSAAQKLLVMVQNQRGAGSRPSIPSVSPARVG